MSRDTQWNVAARMVKRVLQKQLKQCKRSCGKSRRKVLSIRLKFKLQPKSKRFSLLKTHLPSLAKCEAKV